MANRNVSFYKDATKLLGGDSGKRDYDWRRLMAEQLMKAGGSTAPVGSTLEGVTRALSGVAGGYFAGEARREDKAKEEAGDNERSAMLKAFIAGVPGKKTYMSEEAAQGRAEEAVYQAADAQAPGDGDMYTTPRERYFRETAPEMQGVRFAALPAQDETGRFDQAPNVTGMDALNNMTPKTRGGRNMLDTLMMSDWQRKQVIAAEKKTAERDQEYELAKIRAKPGPDTRTPLEKNLAALGLVPGSEEFNSAMKKGIEKMPPRPYDTTAGIKDANELAFRRKALRDAKTPEEKARAKQRLDDFDLILSKSFETIRGKASAQASGVQAVEASGSAFESLNKINLNMGNLDDAIAALRKGARTGAIDQYLPNIRASSVELRNIQNRLGLDVIGAVTFGALSKGELDLALETALPTSLDEPKLLAWLEKRKEGQRKLANYYSRAASYLGTPGNTVATWVDLQTAEKKAREKADAAAAPSGVTKRLEFDAKGNPVL
jgi:hypothetical protein